MATQFQQLGPADADLLAGHLVRWRRLEGISLEPAHAAREAARAWARILRAQLDSAKQLGAPGNAGIV